MSRSARNSPAGSMRNIDSTTVFLKSLRFGVRENHREATTNNAPYNWQAVTQAWMRGWYINQLATLDQFKAPYSTYSFPNFFNGKLQLPSAVVFPDVSLATGWLATYQQLQKFRTQLCTQFYQTNGWGGCNPPWQWTPTAYSDSTLNQQDEKTYAGYGVARFGFDLAGRPLDGNLGVRVVRTVDKAQGVMSVTAFTPGSNGQLPPGTTAANFASFPASFQHVSVKNSYTDVLPSLNLRWRVTPQFQARLAFAKAVARPDFTQLQAFTSLGSGINTATAVQTFTGTSSGNPRLKPTKSDQFDGTLEWYFAPTGSLTGAVFYKHLTDVVINELYNVTVNDTAGKPHDFTVTGPVNGAKGNVKGFEVAYTQYFDFLPSVLRGFGVQANYTYVDSHQKLYNPVTSVYCTGGNSATNLNLNLNGCDTDARTFGNLPIANLSKNAYNVALLYDLGKFSARLAYNWRSRYLQAVNVNGTQGGRRIGYQPDEFYLRPDERRLGSANLGRCLRPVGRFDFLQADRACHDRRGGTEPYRLAI